MDFVHGGPSGLEISSLKLVMHELASCKFDQRAADAITSLQVTCKKIEDMLEGWNGDQISGTVMETLLDSLEGYCYDLEDFIDDIRLGKRGPDPVMLTFTAKWSPKFVNLHRNFERVCSEIESVCKNLKPQQLRINQSSPSPFYKSLSFDGTPLIGRVDDLQSIISEMCDGLTCGVSIIGMDGIGKTSLARCIMGHNEIQYRFSPILPVYVSAHFQIEDIAQQLRESYSETKWKATDSDPRDPRDGFSSRRTLFILDDLWSVKDGDWQRFQSNFLGLWRRKIKVLITTRNPKVAAVTETTAHYLGGISDEDCKSLIMAKSGLIDAESDIWASDVGVIARKCQGMPMVAAMFGFKLSRKRSLDERIESMTQIKDTNLWELPEFKEVFPSLKLNEPKLPPHLKRCFAYFSLFSPNQLFNKEDLIQLWEAQGFVRPQHQAGSQPTGSQCFDDLVSRSILRTQKSSSEMQPLYELNVFHHEFARLLASKAFLNLDGGTPSFPTSCKNIRHLALTCENIDVSLLKKMKGYKRLRTFIVRPQHGRQRCTSSLPFLGEFKSLRLLNLSQTNITKLPKSLSQLYHLRYLDLSESDIESLPYPIHSLCELQTLKLQNCNRLKRLPEDLNQLVNLMRLYVNMKHLKHVPTDLGKLINLEILCSFDVRSEGNTIAELKNMNRLREIHISGLQNISSTTEAQESMLSKKHALKILVLEWGLTDCAAVDAGNVLGCLQPHNVLRELIVRNYQGERFPAWLTSSSRMLVSIHLENCHGCKLLPSLGQLPFLKMLTLDSIHDVKVVDKEFFGEGRSRFPSLESLNFFHMENLSKWIYLKAGDMRCLHSLKFINCPRLVYLPSLENQFCGELHSLEINECPKVELIPEIRKHVKEIIIDGVLDKPENEDISPAIDKYKEAGDEKVMGAEPNSSPSHWSTQTPLYFSADESLEDKDVISHYDEIDLQHPGAQTPLYFSADESLVDDDVISHYGQIDLQHAVALTPLYFSEDESLAYKDVISHYDEIDLQHPGAQTPLYFSADESLADDDVISHNGQIGLLQHPVAQSRGVSDEERDDRQEDDAENGVHYPKESAISNVVLQHSSKQTEKDVSMIPHEAKVSDPVIMEETEEYFSILSLLPKNYEFDEDTLIQLWMAAGHMKDETKGKQHFNHLLNQKYLLRSGTNFITNKDRYHINIETCQKIQQFSEGQNDTLKWENECNTDKYSSGIQHVSLVFKGIDQTIFQKLQQFRELRTLLFLANYGPRVKEIPAHFFKSFNKLRALDLSGTHIKKLPSSVGHMQYLRYLDLSRTLIEWLPGTICSLKELQTLKLQECWELCKLPEQLNNLTELRDLDVDVLCQLTTMPKGMKALRNLRTLSAFLVGTEDGYKVNELENLNNLTGDFCIAKLENVGSEDEARNAALDKKMNIKRLELRWTAPAYSCTDKKSDPKVVQLVLERLEPCSVLEELQILCYEGSTFPSWVNNNKFEKLVHVSFYKCEKMSMLPSLEQLPSLKYLVLVQMNSVERFEVQGMPNMVAFPSLETVKMDGMQSLRTWRLLKRNGDDFKSLTEIMINDCPSLEEFDGSPLSLSSIKCLEISKCPKLASISDYEILQQTLDTLIVEDCDMIRKNCTSSEDEDDGGGEDESLDVVDEPEDVDES